MKYSEDYLNLLKQKRKKRIFILLVAVCLSGALLLALFLSATYTKEIFTKIVTCINLTLIGWVCIYEILFYLYPLNKQIQHLDLTMRSNSEFMIGKIVKTGKLKTITKEIKGYDIECNVDGSILRFYLHTEMGEVGFKKGNKVKLTVKNNFITEYEVVTDE